MPGSQQTEEKMFWKPNRTDKRIILHLAAYPVYTTPNMLPLTKLELSDAALSHGMFARYTRKERRG